MADRRVWWGVGALTLGIGAALLTGSATAAANTGADSDSSHSSSSSADHDTAKSGSDNSPSPRRTPKTTTDAGSGTTTGASETSTAASDPGTSTTKATTEQSAANTRSAGASENSAGATENSAGATETKPTDKPSSGSRRPHAPQRVVQLRITKPDVETTQATTQATADPVERPSTTPASTEAVTDSTTSTTADVTPASTSATTDPSSPTTADPTALPRGPTTVRALAPRTFAVIQTVAAPLAAPAMATPVTEPTASVSQSLSSPTVTEPTQALSEPATTPMSSEPVAALVTVDPQLVPMPDPTMPDPTTSDPAASDPTGAGTPTMRFAAMQTMAAPQLLSAAAPTLTTPITPVVIGAPPTVGPIATAFLDILASFGWRASPLAVAVFPALTPWSGAPIPTPIPAVQDISGTTPPTTADTVLVGHSTLYIPCGPTGYAARTDWYFPVQPNGEVNPQGVIWVQNGFLANSGFYTALASNLAANTNSIVAVPTITSNPFSCAGCWLNGASMQAAAASLFVGNRDALNASAQLAGYQGTLPDSFILSGHSAGGGFAAATAGYTIANGAAFDPLHPTDPTKNFLKGVVMFDGVPGFGVLPSVAPQLRANQIPIYQIAAQNQIWNLWGSGTNELVAANPGAFNGVVIYHGSHVDSMLGGNPVVDFFAQLVTKFSPPGATQAVYTFADGWINDMYAGTAPVGPPPTGNPLYPEANQPVQVGRATAYGLPSPTGQRSTLGEIIYGIISFFNSLFGA